mmetsp:Transcript_61539/g.178454  ORF Transcript_61539/g.178454 Transcript_61539/m.178454 type:complete len:460 (-) Transcript_61539:351-1730(-)
MTVLRIQTHQLPHVTLEGRVDSAIKERAPRCDVVPMRSTIPVRGGGQASNHGTRDRGLHDRRFDESLRLVSTFADMEHRVSDIEERLPDAPALFSGAAARKYRPDKCRGFRQERRTRRRQSGGRHGRRRVDPVVLRTREPSEDRKREAEDGRRAIAAAAAASPHELAEDKGKEPQWKLDWGPKTPAWEKLLQKIHDTHEWRIRKELGPATELLPVYPEKQVQERFLSTRADLEHAMSIGYHGTKAENIPSIARRGLIIPGRGGVKVQNGSVHGVGVYTARIGKASLSKGFAQQGSVFVCGLLDTSEPLTEGDRPEISSTKVMSFKPVRGGYAASIGGHKVSRVSEEVLHVGDAMVVFREQCVVPLFLEVQRDLTRFDWEPAQQVGRRRVAMPEEGRNGVVFAADGRQQRGRTAWLTPPPLVEGIGWARRLRRRQNRRELKVKRKTERCSRTGAFESESE